jgi:alpha-ketoglutarate-dependent taurine dioxygenase
MRLVIDLGCLKDCATTETAPRPAVGDPPDGGLAGVDRRRLLSLLAAEGVLLLRGFEVSPEGFAQLVRRVSSRVTLDPAREFRGDVAQKVDAGHAAVGLHCENGNTPFQPDLCWFHCERAADRGSQTTVCDGYAVWDALSAGARAAFSRQPIRYLRRVEAQRWRRFVSHARGGQPAPEQVTVADLRALAAGRADLHIEPNADGSIVYSFVTGAVHPTLFGSRPAFANSILGPSYNYEAPVISFADGTPLSADLLAEVRQVTERLTEDIDWQDGDVVLIDNTRVMHGRRRIEDPRRSIFNALSFI